MTDEELFEAVTKNPDKMGENLQNEIRKGTIAGACVCIVLCVIMCGVELLLKNKLDFGKPAIILVLGGFINVFEARASQQKKTLVLGIVEFVLAVFCILLYIGELFV